ncbi:MAG: GNAT family N-acetyltransferase [Alphaproteobacteria bacterium]|nr:GNAT family N-acetyltransferase [Alphaproteobacteria bacterium]
MAQALALRASAPSASAGFKLQVSGSLDDFGELWPTMEALAGAPSAHGHAFQCRDHLRVWLDTIGAALGVRPVFVGVRSAAGAPLLFLPLGIRKHRGLRILGFLDGGVCDYNAPILFDGAAGLAPDHTRALWESICRAAPRFDVALLEKCPEFVGSIRNPLYDLTAEPWPMSGHRLLLGPDTPAEALEKTRDLKDSIRKRKRIAEIGTLTFNVARERDEIDAVFATFVRQKSQRYLETLGHPGFDVPGQQSYYHELTRRLSGRGVQLAYLSVDAEIVATAWSLISARHFYYLMCAYEAGRWAKYSPGRLLMEELIAWAQSQGIEVFDLGIGDEAYKLKWRQQDFALGGAVLPRTAAGYLYRTGLGLRRSAKAHLPSFVIRAAKQALSKDRTRMAARR